MNKNLKRISIPVIALTFLTGTVFGGSVKSKIDVVFNSINIKVNGKKIKTPNILYNETTYVPLREVAEMLGKEVDWDQSNRTAIIDDKEYINDNLNDSEMKYYANGRFGFSVKYPKEWGEVFESDNGDGAILYKDEDLDVRAYAGHMLDDSFQDYIKTYYKGWKYDKSKEANVLGANQSVRLVYSDEERYKTALIAEKNGIVYTFHIDTMYLDDIKDSNFEEKSINLNKAEEAEMTFKILYTEYN